MFPIFAASENLEYFKGDMTKTLSTAFQKFRALRFLYVWESLC